MRGRLKRFLRNLAGNNDEMLLAPLLAQLEATVRAAALARSLAAGEVATDVGDRRMDELESEGDTARRALIEELRHALAVPIDREDLNRVSRSIDDVLDNLRDLARELHLYGLGEEPLLLDPIANLEAGVRGMDAATRCLLDRPQDAARLAAESKKNDVRRSYQFAMASLLTASDTVDTTLLRRRELLRRIDITGLRLAEAADALADGAVKRSH
ncbi:DUF47 domain-containing protein [Egicoccus sp. AB-alg6-2]|uniref:DUF47 domain-containing protein n=1 Tax=Egicoccus sp. AB-alg6-2 TaxID=3242692 RepID=UPI00359ED08A